MNTVQTILDTEYVLRQQLVDSALINVEQFRSDATRVLKSYTPRERAYVKEIQKAIAVTDFFQQWSARLQQDRAMLKTNADNKSFLNSLQKYLLVEAKDSTHVAHSLILQQDAVLVERFIDSLDLPDNRRGQKVHQTIAELLKWSDQHLLSMRDHYTLSVVYQSVAAEYGVNLRDPHTTLFKRSKASRHIRKERRQLLRAERTALRTIDQQLQAAASKPLVKDILATKLEPIEFLSARASYDKKLAALPVEESRQIAVRTALMTQESRQLLKAFHKANGEPTSENINEREAFINELIRKIFSLSTVQKNQLVLHYKAYRDISTQKSEILATQQARKDVLVEND